MDKKLSKTIIITLITIIILCLAVTTAYFAVSVSNTNNEKINENSATLSIVYTDCASSKQSDCANMTKNLSLGESFEKTFKVQNNGTVPVDYKIIFKQLTNTFQNGDLVYTIKDLSDNVLQNERPVPYASSQTTNVNAFLDTISANTTKEFKIVVTLKLKQSDQSVNSSATYSIKLGLTTQNEGADFFYNLVSDADPNSTDIITKTAPEGNPCTNTLAYDGTSDNNLRFVGRSSCNYAVFADNLNTRWEIIGVMNNVDDGTGNKETRIKLLRASSLGKRIWGTSNVNNVWPDSTLMQKLNSDFLDATLTENQSWPGGTYYYTDGMTAFQQNLIKDAVWHLGGLDAASEQTATSAQFYEFERGNITYADYHCTNCTRPTTWTGKVGLMYPSDYGLAVGGNIRNECLNGALRVVFSHMNLNCVQYTNYVTPRWTITPVVTYSYYDYGNNLTYSTQYVYTPSGNNGLVKSSVTTSNYFNVHPAIYLKPSVKITDGDGSYDNPYIIS